MSKVTVVGATGNVGMFAAHAISEIPYVSEILLHGRPGREELLDGIAHDLMDSFAACGNYTKIDWTTDIEEVKGSEIVVCTAGNARHPGQGSAS
jgi:malate dehydrogenase